MNVSEDFIRRLPNAELHIHIEGSFEPDLMFEIARRNRVRNPIDSVDAVRAADEIEELQAFPDQRRSDRVAAGTVRIQSAQANSSRALLTRSRIPVSPHFAVVL